MSVAPGSPMPADGDEDFRGVGWAWPVAPDSSGAIELARYEESIRQSILLIVGTAKGERLMRPTFGCGIHDLSSAFGSPDRRSGRRSAIRILSAANRI